MSKDKLVKVIHIGNPKLVIASESEFLAIVQSLTRNKSPSLVCGCYDSSSFAHKRLKEDFYGSQVNTPKFTDETEAPVTHQIPNRFSTFDLQQEEMISYLYNIEMLEKLEKLGDTNFGPDVFDKGI